MTREYLIFRLDTVLCALPREDIQEILPYVALSIPPGLPAILAGFVNLGGRVLPVLHLARILGLPSGAEQIDRHLIHLRQAQRLCLVDRVLGLSILPEPLQIDPDHVFNNWAVGFLRYGQEDVYLMRVEQLLLREESQRVAGLQAQMQQRLLGLESLT